MAQSVLRPSVSSNSSHLKCVSDLKLFSALVKTSVVPLLSDRWMTVMLTLGSTPTNEGLAALFVRCVRVARVRRRKCLCCVSVT